MTVATFRRVIPARLPPLRAGEDRQDSAQRVVRRRAATKRRCATRIEAFFADRGWQIRKREFGGEEWSFVDKHNWARRGVLVAHVGFVIIAAGTTIYWARGYSGSSRVLSGAIGTIPQTGATIALKQFGYRIDPIVTKSGIVYQPIDYVSHATITGKDGKPHDAIDSRQPSARRRRRRTSIRRRTASAITFALTHNGAPVAGPPATPAQRGRSASTIAGTSRVDPVSRSSSARSTAARARPAPIRDRTIRAS